MLGLTERRLIQKMKLKSKKGFSTVTGVMTSLISVGFLLVFSLLFFTYMTDDGLTGTDTITDNVSERFVGNYSAGIDEVSSNIGTVFTIAVFVLIISVLLIAYVFARRNGLMGGGQLG